MNVHRSGAAKLPRTARRPAAGPVSVSYFRPPGVLPRVWNEALVLAGGQHDRLRVMSPATVLVLNRPDQKLPGRRRRS